MDGKVLPKTIPSQEWKSPWLHPLAVQRVINSLRAKAQATSKTRDVRVKPYRNRHEGNNVHDNEPNEARPNCDSAAIDKDRELYDFEIKELKYGGWWRLLFDRKRKDGNGLTEQDTAWFKIEELVEKGLVSYAMASTAAGFTHPDDADKHGRIWCFTEDCTDEHDVRITAEVIRKALLVELGDKEILYVQDTVLKKVLRLTGTSVYRQTSDYKFWKKGNNGEWHHVDRTKRKPVQITSTDFCPAVPSKVKTVSWIGPSVVEREKYNIRQKASFTSVKDTVQDHLGKIFVENTTPCIKIKTKDNAQAVVIESMKSRLRAETSKEGDKKKTWLTVMKSKETNLGTTSSEDEPSESKNNSNYSEKHLNNISLFQDVWVCSAENETRPDDSQAVDPGTHDCTTDQPRTNEDSDGGDEDDGKQQREKNYRGMWVLLFDKTKRDTSMLTELDRAWMKIDDLCEKSFLQYAVVSTAAFNSYPCSATVGCILCYTEDYKNEEDVGWRSDIIRQTLEEELEQSIIYYSKANPENSYNLEDDCKYVQTPDYCLWKNKSRWILVPRMKGISRTGLNFMNRELVPSKIAYREWIHVRYTRRVSRPFESAPIYVIVDAPKTRPPVLARPNESALEGIGVKPNRNSPVQVQMDDSSELEDYGGKWMLHLDRTERDHNGLTLLDRVWFKLEDLCLEKCLKEVSVSTAKGGELAHTPGVGCICCFTEDYRNIGDVHRKGYLIRKTLEEELWDIAIYYKTNAATEAAQYSVFGCKRICIYKLEPDGSLWGRIVNGFSYWKRIY